MSFREIKPEELKENPFDLIGKQWMLITAGDETKCNTMTASWGGVGSTGENQTTVGIPFCAMIFRTSKRARVVHTLGSRIAHKASS